MAAARAKFSATPRPLPDLPHVDGILAGAAEADLTPPPGMPKAGYSANAHDGNGFRTRIRARVTHLRAGKASIAIVQCDLLAGSSVIQYLVAEAIADRTDIPLAGLWIGATHTHAGPGQFLGTDFYNHHASNRAGFDPAYTQFLVEQIAGAVIEAHDTRGPAKVAVGSTEVWGLTRNRSHDPHVQNRTVTDKRLDPQRKWVAVNPQLHMIRVDRIVDGDRTEPLAAAVIFSIHGTGVSQHVHEYNADVWAYLVGELKHQIQRRHHATPIVGASEGTHADVAPALRPGLAGHREAQRIGRGIGAEAADLYDRLGHELRPRTWRSTPAFARSTSIAAPNRRIDDVETARPSRRRRRARGRGHREPDADHPPHPAVQGRAPAPHRPQGRRTDPSGSSARGGVQRARPPEEGVPAPAARSRRCASATPCSSGSRSRSPSESGRRIGAAVGGARRPTRPSTDVIVSLAGQRVLGLRRHRGGVRPPVLRGRPHPLRPQHPAVPRPPRPPSSPPRPWATTLFIDVGDRRWDLAAKRYLARRPTARRSRAPLQRQGRRSPTPRPPTTPSGSRAGSTSAPAGLHWHEPLVRVEQSDDDGATWVLAAPGGRPADDQGWALEISHTRRPRRRSPHLPGPLARPGSPLRPAPPLRAARQQRSARGGRRPVRLTLVC